MNSEAFDPHSMPLGLIVMAVLYVIAGALHFLKPKVFVRIMPPYLPKPLLLVYLSGVAEIVLGLALFVTPLRPLAIWGVIALLLAVLPANVFMASEGQKRFKIPNWVLWARLPLQFVLMAWAYSYL